MTERFPILIQDYIGVATENGNLLVPTYLFRLAPFLFNIRKTDILHVTCFQYYGQCIFLTQLAWKFTGIRIGSYILNISVFCRGSWRGVTNRLIKLLLLRSLQWVWKRMTRNSVKLIMTEFNIWWVQYSESTEWTQDKLVLVSYAIIRDNFRPNRVKC